MKHKRLSYSFTISLLWGCVSYAYQTDDAMKKVFVSTYFVSQIAQEAFSKEEREEAHQAIEQVKEQGVQAFKKEKAASAIGQATRAARIALYEQYCDDWKDKLDKECCTIRNVIATHYSLSWNSTALKAATEQVIHDHPALVERLIHQTKTEQSLRRTRDELVACLLETMHKKYDPTTNIFYIIKRIFFR